MNIIKTKISYTIPLDIILISLLFIITTFFSQSILSTILGKIFISISILFLLFGLWKIEYYKVINHTLKKYQFLGLITYRYNLKKVTQCKTTQYSIEFDYLVFSNVFSNQKNHKNIRKIKLHFSDGRKMTIYENSIENRTEVNLIIQQIKKYKLKL